MAKPGIGFIGAGRTATALAVACSRAGYEVPTVASHTAASAQALASRLPNSRACADAQQVVDACDLVFLTVPDDAIRSVVETLRWRTEAAVVHCSGALSREALSSAAAQGAATAGLHPLRSFAGRDADSDFAGVYFGLEAEGPLAETLAALVADLGGNVVLLRAEDRALYHAAAVLASNYVVTLVKAAGDLWLLLGQDRAAATRALAPLLRGVVDNIEALGVPAALTGPIARGDVESVRRHVEALAAAPELLLAYRELGRLTLPIGLAKGSLDEASASKLRDVLDQPAACEANR